MHPLLFQFGRFSIPTYGAFTAMALVVGLAALTHVAGRLALHPHRLWNLGVIGILAALVAARLLLVAEYFGAFRTHPFWVLGLTAIRSWWVNPAAACIGFCAAMLYALAEGLPLRRTLDCMAPAAALALAIHSVGAFFAGTDFGLPVVSGWSVIYTSDLAARWYHTPLGVRLYPTQLYSAAAWAMILMVLLWRISRRPHAGELCGMWLFLAGMAGFFLEFYRDAPDARFWLHQALCVGMVAVSAVFLLRVKRSYTGVNEAQHV